MPTETAFISTNPDLSELLRRARVVREAFDLLPLESKVAAVEAGAAHWKASEEAQANG